MRAKSLAMLALLAVCTGASAAGRAAPDYRIAPNRFTHEEGLPQSGVNAIVQDREGFLWLGTFGGLARFDGSRFRIFRGHSASAGSELRTGPASDRIVSLLADDRGRLWIGTQDAGVSVLEHGTFRHLPVCGTCRISDIEQASDRTIWIAGSEGVFRLDPESERAVLLPHPDPAGYSHLAIDRGDRVFVGGRKGLRLVVGDRLHGVPLPEGDTSPVRMLRRDGDFLLVGTTQRLYRYRPDRALWVPQDVLQPKYAARDARGHWWATQENGQVLRERGPGDWHPVPELAGLGITALALDDEDNLWIGTGTKGLLRLREPVFGLLSTAQLGTDAAGRAVVADGQGGIWYGVACGPLQHRAADLGMRRFPIREALGSDCVSNLSPDGRGTLWIGTGSGVLGRLQGGVVDRVASWREGESLGVWAEGEGRLIVAAGTSTYRVRVDGDGHLLRRHRIAALDGMRVNRVVPAARGGTWFVGDQGVRRLVRGRVVERWSPREGLSSRFARALYEGDDGVLWVGTYGAGLNRIADGRVHRYGSDNGLSDETVSCILADRHGRLWLGGNSGVTLLPSPQEAGSTIQSVAFGSADGLLPSEINGGTSSPCMRDGQGLLWFSLVEGFAVLDPARIPGERPAPLRAHIEGVAVAGEPREIADGVLRLASFTRNLQIGYTAINLRRPQGTRFRFRLSGFDADWVDAGQNRDILYPTVPWGEHLFEVQARAAGRAWSPAASLRIVHPQPWYQRPWIWTLATSMGLIVLLGATRQDQGPSWRAARRRRAGSDRPRAGTPHS